MIERYEFKYLVEPSQIERIRSAARDTCVHDDHARQGGTYTIRSLYFDTPGRHLYRANGRQAPDRFKARVRCYPDTDAPVFLEIKRRTLDVIRKTRGAVSPEDWVGVVRRHPDAQARVQAAERSATNAFVVAAERYGLEPVLLVEYEREAYVSLLDRYGRLTLDRAVRAQRMERFDLEAESGRWRPVDHALQTSTQRCVTVLELKFERRPPRWMVDLVRHLDLIRESFSKYCYGLSAQAGATLGPMRAVRAWGPWEGPLRVGGRGGIDRPRRRFRDRGEPMRPCTVQVPCPGERARFMSATAASRSARTSTRSRQ